jgi:uncharacterized DUF497 family protein
VEFEWDPTKAEANLRKHGIAFGRALRVFDDPVRQEFPDTSEDYGEDRWVTVGSVDQVVLTVIFTQRRQCIRLISARRAIRDEQQLYWNGYLSV